MNKWWLAIICFLFGYLGIHRFIVGKIGTGFVYLFTGGVFGIGYMIDFFMILVGTFTRKNGEKV